MRDLEADLKLCEAATEGPWVYKHPRNMARNYSSGSLASVITTDRNSYPVAHCYGENFADGDLIAAARTGWPETIQELITARNRINELESEIQHKDAILLSLTERVAAQSELLGKRSEKLA